MNKIFELDNETQDEVLEIMRKRANADNAEIIVRRILDKVKKKGDVAVKYYSKKFDNCKKIEILNVSKLKYFYEKATYWFSWL